jgi:predicted transcriptional regulator
VNAGTALRDARRRKALSQRALAARSGVAQPAIARIEAGAVQPRVDTLDALLRACGETLTTERRLGDGVDRTVIRPLLDLTPSERLRLATEEARNLDRALARANRPRR